MKIKYYLLSLMATLLLLASCSKENSDVMMTEEEEIEAEVISCDLDLTIQIDSSSNTLTALVSGGTEPFVYMWSNGATEERIIVDESGTYSVEVTDAEGCFVLASMEVELGSTGDDCNDLSVSIDYDTDNSVLSALVEGGNAPFTYVWSNGEVTDRILVNAPGVYTVMVIDAIGCTFEISYDVVIDGDPCMGLDGEILPGADGNTLVINVTGGTPPYVYDWSTGEMSQTIVIDIFQTYSVTVTDAMGCTIVREYGDFCNGLAVDFEYDDVNQMLTASVSGGTAPYIYIWSDEEMTETITVVQGETYRVEIVDALGCVVFNTFMVP